MRAAQCFGLALVAGLLLTGCEEGSSAAGLAVPSEAARASHRPEVVMPAVTASKRPPLSSRAPAGKAAAPAVLLRAAAGGDGDSWKDTRGVEYRLGLVNSPELSECYGGTASAKRKALTSGGFRASSYTVDQYGRRVSVVFLADGRNLNVWLARHGYANDKYLAQFRHENRQLAAELDVAFAAAKREHAGLWGSCGTRPQGFAAAPSAPAPSKAGSSKAQARAGCDASYPDVCIPPAPPDLDCGDISARRFTVLAPDPHRFDADGDGIGCESG
jgi:micrococcal nuclease